MTLFPTGDNRPLGRVASGVIETVSQTIEPLLDRDRRRPPERSLRFPLVEPVSRRELLSKEPRHGRIVGSFGPFPDLFHDRARTDGDWSSNPSHLSG